MATIKAIFADAKVMSLPLVLKEAKNGINSVDPMKRMYHHKASSAIKPHFFAP
ncbi:MAG: hypothetical protein LBE92_00030 [Chryseobacterium sp.]|uniref:hypothetical protein n=1 Tax=Chryseobacterium sp. TaxID=1871047 RepID=UPI00282CC8C9|nr:hypothetical protein [Chryseobacterium sp.]MDR2234484.1 hypothetical protein [Chryseobacterium sp.]